MGGGGRRRGVGKGGNREGVGFMEEKKSVLQYLPRKCDGESIKRRGRERAEVGMLRVEMIAKGEFGWMKTK